MADGENLGIPTQVQAPQMSASDYFRAMMAQQNPQGMTQLGPQMPKAPPSAVQPAQEKPTDYGTDRSFQTVGERQRAERQNFVNTLTNMTQKLNQAVQQKKQREIDQVFDRAGRAVDGINQAQAQMQEAQQSAMQAAQRLQQNPNDQEAQQTLLKAKEQVQRAQEALQINTTILRDEYNPGDPKGAKRLKILQKGIGVDDKNAASPERQAAIKSIQKRMGDIGPGIAGILARQPQTQQLSPEAQQRQMLQQAGVVGKPATGGQVLAAGEKDADRQAKVLIANANNAVRQGISAEKLEPAFHRQGLMMVHNPDGTVSGRLATPEERKADRMWRAEDDLAKAKTDAQNALTDTRMNPKNPQMQIKAQEASARMLDAQARMVAAQAAQLRAQTTAMTKESPEAAAAHKHADQINEIYTLAQKRLKDRSAIGDTGLVMNWVKATVAGAGRMTNVEIEAALRSGSLGTRASNLWNRAQTGKLDDTYVKEIVEDIKKSAEAAQETASKYDAQKKAASDMSYEEFKGLLDVAAPH